MMSFLSIAPFVLLIFTATGFRISRENDSPVQVAIGVMFSSALCVGAFFFLYSFAEIGLGVSLASVLAAPIVGWFSPEIGYLLGFKKSPY